MKQSRSSEKEIIDLGPDYYSNEEYRDCLVKLDQIGKWLGGDAATFAPLKQMNPPPDSILDVGCGGGLFAIKLASFFSHTQVTGIDINPLAIQFADEQLAKMEPPLKNIAFVCTKQEKLTEPSRSYDAVIATLVCHHLSDADLIDFIVSACRIAKRKVIINDLHRHPLSFSLFGLVSSLFFRNRLIQHDGLLSIKKGFTYDELVQMLTKAGIKPSCYRITWRWAFRWILEIDCTKL